MTTSTSTTVAAVLPVYLAGAAQAPFPTTRLLLRVACDTKLMALLHGDHPPVGGEIGVCVCLTRYQETPNDETDELMIEVRRSAALA
mgnify:CR=1 FL=1